MEQSMLNGDGAEDHGEFISSYREEECASTFSDQKIENR